MGHRLRLALRFVQACIVPHIFRSPRPPTPCFARTKAGLSSQSEAILMEPSRSFCGAVLTATGLNVVACNNAPLSLVLPS